MAPSAVNDAGRADEGLLARWYADTNGTLTSGGSSNAYTLSPNRTVSAYFDGLEFIFQASFANTSSATLNVSSIGAKSILKHNDQSLASGDIESGQLVHVIYESTADAFQMLSHLGNAPAAIATANTFTADQTIKSTDAGATEGPALDLHRDSASPADSDLIGVLRFKGEDDGSTATTYAKLNGVIDDVTDTTEDGRLKIATVIAGTLADRIHIGAGLYSESATGGDQGVDTINVSTVYQDGVAVTPGWITGSFDLTDSGANDLTTANVITSIPDGVNEIELWIEAGSTDSANQAIMIQLVDSGGAQATGYSGKAVTVNGGATAQDANSTGFLVTSEDEFDAATTFIGSVVLRHYGSNVWSMSSHGVPSTTNATSEASGLVTLDDDIDGVNFTTSGGTAAYDGGTVYYRYR